MAARSEVRQFEVWGMAIAAVVIVGVLPALNAFLPETNSLHVSNFTINLYGKYLTYAVLAIGVDVLWGFTGLLSLGQCLSFALEGYPFGMYLMLKMGNSAGPKQSAGLHGLSWIQQASCALSSL